MAGLDLIIGNARLESRPDRVQIGIAGGRIAAIAPRIDADTPREDAGGCLAFPGYVESHIHLDKAHILDRCDMTEAGLSAAVDETARAKADFTEPDVYARAARVVEAAILHGTTVMRTFVELDPRAGMRGFEAIRSIRRDYAQAIDIEICAFAQEGLTNEPETGTLLAAALDSGADLVGGCSYRDPDPVAHIRGIFDLAERFGVDADFHIDFDLDPDSADLPALIAETEARGYGGRVVAGHATKLSVLSRGEATAMGRRLADAGIGVVALPATDLFLLGRDHDRLIPRGVAPLAVLAEAGVTTAVASNNILNPFTPYGDANLVRMANLFANVAQLSTPEDLNRCFAMVGRDAARLMRRDHGLAVGGPADIVLVDAPDAASAVRQIAPVSAGWKRGVPTFRRPSAELLITTSLTA